MNKINLGIGFVGCGRAAMDLHLPAIAKIPGLRAVAASDSNSDTLAAALRQGAIPKGYSDYRDLTQDQAVDLILVSVPPFLHAEVTGAALAAGKHVYLEKPLAITWEDATAIYSAGRQANTLTAMGFNLRSHRLVRNARTLISEGAVGSVELVCMTWTCGFNLGREWPTWRFDRDLGGGGFHEIAVHQLDLLRYMLDDEIEWISSESHSAEIPDRNVTITAGLRSGTLASLTVSQRTVDGNSVEIYGQRGAISFSCYRADSLKIQNVADLGGGMRTRLKERVEWLRGFPDALSAARAGGDFKLSFVEHWKRFATSIRQGELLPATLDDGLRAFMAVKAALRSAESGKRIALTEVMIP
ncbi:MAG: Gfo/Idh/MocA family protein [Gammaproteobacteria bacterium]